MFDSSIFSTFWGDSATVIANFSHVQPESLTTLIAFIFRNYLSGSSIFNLQIFLGFAVTLCLTYYAIQKTFKNRLISIITALVLTFAPARIRYSMEWPVLTFWGYYILLFYSVLKYIKYGHKKHLIFSAITFALSFMEQPYLGVILSISTGLASLIYTAITRKKEYIKHLLILYVVLIISGIPGIYNVFKQRYLNDLYSNVNFTMAVRTEPNRWAYSARPWNYLIPDINNPFTGDLAVKANHFIWNHNPYYLTEPYFPKEHTLYLGFTLIALAFANIYLTFFKRHPSFVKYKDFTIFFTILAITAFIFSMPPFITLKGIYIYFPGQLLFKFLPQFRAYARFGAVVFVSTVFLASVTLNTLSKSSKKFLLLPICVLILFEFATPYFANRISEIPTPPYQWLAEQKEDFSYLELPRRIDYTDVLYQKDHDKKILNPYLGTPEEISLIEKSLVSDLGDSHELLCTEFKNKLNGKYIFYHYKEVNKEAEVLNFLRTDKVTPELKIALEESWGTPIWGNHVEKSEEDLQKDKLRRELGEKLKNDPRLEVVKEFSREEISQSQDTNNANKFDAVLVLKVKDSYCY